MPQPQFLQGNQNIGAGSAQDGHAREIRGHPGGDGSAPWEGRRQHDVCDGLFRVARGGNRDEGQRPGAGLRVHELLHHVRKAGTSRVEINF